MIIKSKFIENFIDNLPEKLQKPLDRVITKMLHDSKYIDGSTLIYDENNNEFDEDHYHRWDCAPQNIPEIQKFKNNEYNEDNDVELTQLLGKYSPNIECIKGDVQLGKRLHACILMWVSIFIYERPVVYLFRNITLDKEQLRDDLDGSAPWNFNMKYIKTPFCEGGEIKENKYYDHRLPSLTDIKDKKVANRLSDKEFLWNPKMIYAALMNPTDLKALNKRFYEYIIEYCEKVNITLIIDESDLNAPTATNSNHMAKKDTINAESERLIARLVNKVAHTIHITGTAHTFFWNYTTALSNDTKTFIPVQKVFVMPRPKKYHGFAKNNTIKFQTNIDPWWEKIDRKGKKVRYNSLKDYNVNIKSIINEILQRDTPYNSFLISEEKKQSNQIDLAEQIIKDFDKVFVIVFHGKAGRNGLPTGLRLYYPEKIDDLNIETELQQVVIKEKRLNKPGGIKGTPRSANNDFKYYDIEMKKKEFSIKMIYKVLAMLFKKIKSNRTVITITGKYGERGYSFTSDYYAEDNKYVLHLTDQYFVSHSVHNCSDILQRARIQGKYGDKTNLIFWTTPKLAETIDKYVEYMKKIESKIMSLPRGHVNIRDLCETFLLARGFIKTLGTTKQRKNIEPKRIIYDKKYNARIYSIPPQVAPEDYHKHFSEFCEDQGLSFDGFINRLETVDRDKYLKEHGEFDFEINIIYDLSREDLISILQELKLQDRWDTWERDNGHKGDNIKCAIGTSGMVRWEYKEMKSQLKRYGKNSTHGINNGMKTNKSKFATHIYTGYCDDGSEKHALKIAERLPTKKLPKSSLDILKKQNCKEVSDGKILCSKLNYKFINDNFLEYEFDDETELTVEEVKEQMEKEDYDLINDYKYYFVTADGYVYYHDPNKEIKQVKIQIKTENDLTDTILSFKDECIKEIKGSSRVGVTKVKEEFDKWCEKNRKTYCEGLKDFRKNFEKTTGLKLSKSIGIRGYKIELKI
tara:strand:+ start:1803 stop:4721 length:2919 start_codon:yes stop_codon:yes gene_type:complete